MNIVYVVIHGEKHEGGEVVSVHTTLKSAQKAALKVETCFKGGWITENEENPDYWENGCDFVKVVAIVIKD